MADYTRVIELPAAPVDQVAQALYNRGVAWGRQDDKDKAIADYTRVIELPAAPVDQVAKALVNRGVAWGQRGEAEKAIDDYTRVIELPAAPVDQVAKALVGRGVTRGRHSDSDKAIADYTRVIELPAAPVDQVALALGGRGWSYYELGLYLKFLKDTHDALEKAPDQSFLAFNLGLALLASGRDSEALEAYREAVRKFPGDAEKMGAGDVIEAQKTWLSAERAEPVLRLLRSSGQSKQKGAGEG